MLAKHGCRLIALGIAYADSRQVLAVGRFAWHAAKSTVRLEMADPTAFPDLNAVLADFVASVQAILRENFCGACLQGSFAGMGVPANVERTFAFIDYALSQTSASG